MSFHAGGIASTLDKIGREFNSHFDTRHHMTMTFRMADGGREFLRIAQPQMTSEAEAEPTMVPIVWKEFTLNRLVTTLTRK